MHADAMHWGATSIEQNKASVWSKLRIPAKHINTVKPGNSLYKVKSSSPLHRLAQCRLQGHLTSIAESTQPVDSNERYENQGLNHFQKHKVKFHCHYKLVNILSEPYLWAEGWAALGAVLGAPETTVDFIHDGIASMTRKNNHSTSLLLSDC